MLLHIVEDGKHNNNNKTHTHHQLRDRGFSSNSVPTYDNSFHINIMSKRSLHFGSEYDNTRTRLTMNGEVQYE